MTKFQYTGPAADYPTLGFSVTTTGAILDGTLSTPALTVPPDARWSVYGGGNAESGISRYGSPSVTPTPEPSDGFVLAYSNAANTYTPTDPSEFFALTPVADALESAVAAGLTGSAIDPVTAALVADDTSDTAGALSATLSAQVLYPGNRTVFLGDSITASGDGADSLGAGQWPTVTSIRSKGRVQCVRNAGIGGNTTAQMLARLSTDVLAYDPDVVVVLGGTNDPDAATAQTGLTAIWDALVAAGVRVIACTIPPRDEDPFGKPAALATWIKAQAAVRGFDLIDFYTALTNPADGKWYPTLALDGGVHPTQAGHDVMATVALAQIAPRFPAWTPYLATAETGDPINLIPLPLLLGNRLNGDGSPVLTTPAGYSTSVGSGVTPEMITVPGVAGRVQQFTLTKTATDGANTAPLAPSGADLWPSVVIPGHRVRASMVIQTEGAVLNDVKVGAFLEFAPASSGPGSGGGGLNRSSAGDFADGVWVQEFVVPAGKTRARIVWGCSAPGAGAVTDTKVRFGRPTVVDLGPA